MSTRGNPKSRQAAIYLRISLDMTGEGLAVQRQRELCLAILGQRGWDLAGEYVDNSISATDATKKRPGYDALIADLDAGLFDAVVCYDLDRLTRQPRQLEDWIDRAERGRLALVTANGEADLTTDAGRLFARIKLAVARSEVERKSRRQRDAAKQRSELGRPPLGVRLTGYTPKGDLIPDEAVIVRRIFEEIAAGGTLKGIARQLEADGIKTRHGKPWHPGSARTILTNPRYAGRAVYQGRETGGRGAWPPIVTDDEYDVVQAILDNPERRLQQGTERKWLGSGLYLCGVCDQPVSAWSGARYRCRNGAHVNRSRGPVDEYVEAIIKGRLGRADLAGLLTQTGIDTAGLLAEIDRQKRLIKRAEADYKAELIEAADLKTIRAEARSDLASAETALAAAATRDPAASILTTSNPVAAFLDSDLMTRRATVDFLCKVRLYKGNRYSRTFNPETVQIEWRAA